MLNSESFVIAMRDTHPLVRERTVALSSLAAEPFILFTQERSPLFHETIHAMCREAGFAPRVEQYATQIHTKLGLVAAGLGIAIVPDVARNLMVSDVAFCDIQGSSRTVDVALGWRIRDETPHSPPFCPSRRARSSPRGGSQPRRDETT